MPRLLLALSLLAFSAIALAGDPVATDDSVEAKPVKPGATASTSTDTDTLATRTSPAQGHSSSAARPAVPRWHSLLPGMIR